MSDCLPCFLAISPRPSASALKAVNSEADVVRSMISQEVRYQALHPPCYSPATDLGLFVHIFSCLTFHIFKIRLLMSSLPHTTLFDVFLFSYPFPWKSTFLPIFKAQGLSLCRIQIRNQPDSSRGVQHSTYIDTSFCAFLSGFRTIYENLQEREGLNFSFIKWKVVFLLMRSKWFEQIVDWLFWKHF